MDKNNFDQLVKSVSALSLEQMEQLRRELDKNLATVEEGSDRILSPSEDPAGTPIWMRIIESMKAVPDEVLDRIPADSSEQLDHYLYGSPKRPTV